MTATTATIESFSDLKLRKPIRQALQDEGYEIPTPIQAEAIPHILRGSDLIGCAQTGTGKTAAFSLPILNFIDAERRPAQANSPRVLILSPTRELAIQIGESIETYGRHLKFRHTVVYGGVSQHRQVKALNRGVHILVATPGRLLDLMNQGFIDLDDLEIFVLDEADRMLDMGFLPDLKKIIKHLPEERQSLFFSATMPHKVSELANSLLFEPVRVEVTPNSSTVELIEQVAYIVPKNKKRDLLFQYLKESNFASAIIFTRTKRGADMLAERLHKAKIKAEAIHGNKSQAARQRILTSFKTGKTHILVATDLAARGLDVDGISHVINFDMPQEAEDYVHRIGRTGRAGSDGIAVTFCEPSQRRDLRDIERLTESKIELLTVDIVPISTDNDGETVEVDEFIEDGREEQPKRPRKRKKEFGKSEYRKSEFQSDFTGAPGGGRKFKRKPGGKPFRKNGEGSPEGFAEKPYGRKPYVKKSSEDGNEGPAKPYGRKPYGKKKAEGEGFSERPYGHKPYGKKKPQDADAPAKPYGRNPYAQKKSEEAEATGENNGGRKSYGKKKAYGSNGSAKSYGRKSFGKNNSDGSEGSTGKPFGRKPFKGKGKPQYKPKPARRPGK